MNGLRSEAVSRYLAWAKLQSSARFNLAVSGVLDCPLAELPVQIEDFEIGGTGPYGYQPLMERLAAKAVVSKECVVYTLGTSMANFVALTTLVHRGDEVLIERPTYEPLLTDARSHRGQGKSLRTSSGKGIQARAGENSSTNSRRIRVWLFFATCTTQAARLPMKVLCNRQVLWRPRLEHASLWMKCIWRPCLINPGGLRFIWERILLSPVA